MEHEETRAQRRQSAQFTALGLRAATRSPIRKAAVIRRTRRSFGGQIASGLKTFGSAMVETAVTMARGNVPIPIGGVRGGTSTQLQAITRQQLAKIPLPVKIGAGIVTGAGVAQGVEVLTGRSPARIIHDVGSAAFPFSGQPQTSPRSKGMANGNGLRVGQELPPSHVVVRTWQTFPGGPIFARLADGHIAVQKKDGTIKHFRPYRPVVIPRKWNARSMSRVATALKRQRKTATKILKITGGVPTRTVRTAGKSHRSIDV